MGMLTYNLKKSFTIENKIHLNEMQYQTPNFI